MGGARGGSSSTGGKPCRRAGTRGRTSPRGPGGSLHSPLQKSLLSLGSRSTSLPPESEEWGLWEVPVPRGDGGRVSPPASPHLLGDWLLGVSGHATQPAPVPPKSLGSSAGNQGLRDIWGKGGCGPDEGAHLWWRHRSCRGRGLRGRSCRGSRGWVAGTPPASPG